MRLFRGGELDQFHLLELVLADEAAGVLAVGAGLGAEAGRVGGVFDRQGRFLQGFASVDVGHRHFGRGDEPQVPALDPEQVLLELGQLAGAGHGRGVDQEGRQHLGVAVPLGVQIEKEVDQGPRQARAEPLEQGEAGPGDPGGGLEVEDAESFADLPVGQGREGKFRDCPPAPDLHVVPLVPSLGHIVVTEVGDGQDDLLQLAFDLCKRRVQLLDPFGNGAHLDDERLGAGGFPGLLERGDGAGDGVALVLERLDLGEHGQSPAVRGGELVDQLRVDPAQVALVADEIEIFPDKT